VSLGSLPLTLYPAGYPIGVVGDKKLYLRIGAMPRRADDDLALARDLKPHGLAVRAYNFVILLHFLVPPV
jgi:hypothetical protein